MTEGNKSNHPHSMTQWIIFSLLYIHIMYHAHYWMKHDKNDNNNNKCQNMKEPGKKIIHHTHTYIQYLYMCISVFHNSNISMFFLNTSLRRYEIDTSVELYPRQRGTIHVYIIMLDYYNRTLIDRRSFWNWRIDVTRLWAP